MSPSSLATHVATWCVASSLAAGALAEPLTIDQALELSRMTGRPVLAVAGSKT